jgi:hypothetical protein
MPPKTNEDYMREIRNIQPAHPLVYERIEQILTEKDKQREEAVARERLKLARVVIDASIIDEDEINEEDFEGVSKVDAFMNGVEHVHRAFRKALTPPTN